MVDNDTTLPPSYSSVVGLSKNQTVENVAHDELSQWGSPLDYAFNTDTVQYQAQSGLRNDVGNPVSLVNARSNVIRSTDSIKTYTTWSIFNILCCSLCLGCIPCHYSLLTKALSKHGDIQGAVKASKRARNANIAITVLGITFLLIYFFVTFSPNHS